MFSTLKMIGIINKRIGLIADAIDEGESFSIDDAETLIEGLFINVKRLADDFMDKCTEQKLNYMVSDGKFNFELDAYEGKVFATFEEAKSYADLIIEKTGIFYPVEKTNKEVTYEWCGKKI